MNDCGPVQLRKLRAIGIEVAQLIPQDSLLVTRKSLRAAIENEQFEEAARLRDVLKRRFNCTT